MVIERSPFSGSTPNPESVTGSQPDDAILYLPSDGYDEDGTQIYAPVRAIEGPKAPVEEIPKSPAFPEFDDDTDEDDGSIDDLFAKGELDDDSTGSRRKISTPAEPTPSPNKHADDRIIIGTGEDGWPIYGKPGEAPQPTPKPQPSPTLPASDGKNGKLKSAIQGGKNFLNQIYEATTTDFVNPNSDSKTPAKERFKSTKLGQVLSEGNQNIRRGLRKNKELSEKIIQLSEQGRHQNGKVKMLAGMVGESQPMNDIGAFLGHLEAEIDQDQPMDDDTLRQIVDDRLNSATDEERKALIKAHNAHEQESAAKAQLRADLKAQFDKARENLKDTPEEDFNRLEADVESYQTLQNEIAEIKKNLGQRSRVGKLAGGAALATTITLSRLKPTSKRTHDTAQTRYVEAWNKLDEAKKKTIKRVGAWGLLGAAVIVGGGYIASKYLGMESGAEIAADGQDSNTSGDITSGGLGDNLDAGRELRGLPLPEDEVAQDTQPELPETVLTPETGEYTGDLNNQTGLMEGTGSNAAAQAIIELGVDYPAHQENPEFQNDIYQLAVDSLEAQGIDQYEMPNDYQLELDQDSLQDFMDKWGPEEAPAEDVNDNEHHEYVAPTEGSTDEAATDTNNSDFQAANTETGDSGDLISGLAEQTPGFSPELVAEFRNSILANPNMLTAAYSGTAIAPQEALSYANIHNSLKIPSQDLGYAQFAENMQRLMRDFLDNNS